MNTTFIDDFNTEARELEKRALIKEVVGATTAAVKGREAGRQAAKATEGFIKRKIHRPLKGGAWKVIKKIEAPATTRLREAGGSKMPTAMQKKMMKGVSAAIENPELAAAMPVPFPGASVIAHGGKRLARKGLAAAYS